MSAQHPSAPSADRFVSLHLPPRGPASSGASAGEVVLARLDDELRPDAIVLTRLGDARARAGAAHGPEGGPGGAGDAGALEVRRVGRVTPESVELLPLHRAGGDASRAASADDAERPRVVPRTADAVVGTVVLRWTTG